MKADQQEIRRPAAVAHDAGRRPGSLAQLEQVGVTLNGNRVLRDISLTIARGEHWALLGGNGSGKTTLLRVLSGHLWPTEGRAALLGQRLGTVDLRALRTRIGWVSPALAESLRQDQTALEVVLTGRYGALNLFFESPGAADRLAAQELLETMGVAALAGRPFGRLSMGERQRVLLARSLLSGPELLLLDEPTAGLDLAAREDFLQALQVLTAAPDGPAVVFVSHHLEELVPGMSHALLLRQGCIVAAGPKAEVLRDDLLSDTLGVPVELVERGGRFWALPGAADSSCYDA